MTKLWKICRSYSQVGFSVLSQILGLILFMLKWVGRGRECEIKNKQWLKCVFVSVFYLTWIVFDEYKTIMKITYLVEYHTKIWVLILYNFFLLTFDSLIINLIFNVTYTITTQCYIKYLMLLFPSLVNTILLNQNIFIFLSSFHINLKLVLSRLGS